MRTLDQVKKEYILYVYVSCSYNKAKTARTLGVSHKTIYDNMLAIQDDPILGKTYDFIIENKAEILKDFGKANTIADVVPSPKEFDFSCPAFPSNEFRIKYKNTFPSRYKNPEDYTKYIKKDDRE